MGHLTLNFDASIFLLDAGERKAELSRAIGGRNVPGSARGRAGEMTLKKFLSILLMAQVLGVVGLLTGSPHGNPIGLIAAFVLLFPGGIASSFILDRLGIQFGVLPIVTVSLLVNIVVWFPLAVLIQKARSRKSEDAGKNASLR